MAAVDKKSELAHENDLANDVDKIKKSVKQTSQDASDAMAKKIDKIKAAAREQANEVSVGNIILWRSPAQSAAVLACGILLFGLKFLLIHRYGYTIPTLLCRVCQLCIIAAGIIHACTHKDLDADQIQEFADRALTNLRQPITNCIGLCCYVLQWKNINTTFEALLLLQLASWLFNVLSISTVVFILFCTTMTVPALYEMNRPVIESFVQKERKQLNNSIAHLCDSLPPAIHTQLHKIGVTLPTAQLATNGASKQRKVQ